MQLSERQERAIGAAATLLAVVVILAAVGGLFWLAARFLQTFANVFLPLAVAAVAALVFQPFFDWLRTRLHLPTPLALVTLFLAVLVPVGAFLTFFGVILTQQISDLLSKLPVWWNYLLTQAQERWPQVVDFLENNPLGQRIKSAVAGQEDALLAGIQTVGGKALSAGAGVLRGLGTLFAWAVAPVYFVFFLTVRGSDATDLEEVLPFLKPETRRDVLFLLHEFLSILVAFFRGQLIIAFLQGLLFAIGFSVVGLKYGLILGLMLGFLNIIPYLGSIVGLGVALPLAYFQQGGGPWTVVWVLVVFTAVQMIEGYVLTPRIMGNRTGLHPMVIIVAVFFWGSALSGILGMILAIPLTAFLVVFWRLAREKYIEEWV